MALDAKQQPNNARCALYYGRELWFRDQSALATKELERYLSLPEAIWPVERAYAMRLLAKIEGSRGHNKEQLAWLHRAVAECPDIREPWIELAEAYGENHLGKMFASSQALNITQRQVNYLSESRCWGYLPHDLCTVSSYWAGAKFKALWHAMQAAYLNPSDPRMHNNLRLIRHDMMDPYATHQRLLAYALSRWGGPVLECGAGWYSTPLLHGICESKHELVTLESDDDWRSQFEYLKSEGHTFVGSEEEIPDHPWGVVFVDGRTEDRPRHIERFLERSEVVVVHDAEDSEHGYAQAVELAPCKVIDKSRTPWTAILSKKPISVPGL
jgi:hypothetical protein